MFSGGCTCCNYLPLPPGVSRGHLDQERRHGHTGHHLQTARWETPRRSLCRWMWGKVQNETRRLLNALRFYRHWIDLTHLRERNVENLSGGELQRFACAVVCIQRADMWANTGELLPSHTRHARAAWQPSSLLQFYVRWTVQLSGCKAEAEGRHHHPLPHHPGQVRPCSESTDWWCSLPCQTVKIVNQIHHCGGARPERARLPVWLHLLSVRSPQRLRRGHHALQRPRR